ncbi:MAG: HK97 gp10 family phage protein [Saprospiraceae bacterium]
MKISLKLSKNMQKFQRLNIQDVIGKALTQSALMVQNKAKQLAPFDTGSLRRSITTDYSRLSRGIAVIGSPVPYATRRHYENFKNPQTLRYLERGYTDQKNQIDRLLAQAFNSYL